MDSVDKLIVVLTILAALGSGLIAGVFFAFSSFVMGALSRVRPTVGIEAMQSINIVVINPVFMLAFVGTAIVSVGISAYSIFSWQAPASLLLPIGSAVYVVGTFLVTILFNVPLNNSLAIVDPESAKGVEIWSHYLRNWTMWNHVRTVAALASAALFILALVYRGAKL